MVTVFRAHGLRMVVFVDDHAPAHVHVFGNGEAKINLLGDGNRPSVTWARGMTRAEVRRALEIVTEQQAVLAARWRDIHG